MGAAVPCCPCIGEHLETHPPRRDAGGRRGLGGKPTWRPASPSPPERARRSAGDPRAGADRSPLFPRLPRAARCATGLDSAVAAESGTWSGVASRLWRVMLCHREVFARGGRGAAFDGVTGVEAGANLACRKAQMTGRLRGCVYNPKRNIGSSIVGDCLNTVACHFGIKLFC